MDHDPDHLYLWPGYFNIRTSRRSGRRVPKDASVLKPDLDGLALAARSAASGACRSNRVSLILPGPGRRRGD